MGRQPWPCHAGLRVTSNKLSDLYKSIQDNNRYHHWHVQGPLTNKHNTGLHDKSKTTQEEEDHPVLDRLTTHSIDKQKHLNVYKYCHH